MTTIPIDLDWEKMVLLLDRFQKRRLSRQEATELKPLLKKYYKRALLKGDTSLANKLSIMVIGLNGIISGDISELDYKRLSNL